MHKEKPSKQDFMDLERNFGAHNYNPVPVVISKGEGIFVWDVDGKKYIDCLCAYSALSFGHRHPKILQALKEQLNVLTLTSRAFHNDKLGMFLKALCEYTGMEQALPMNTGAEAVETGIKIARRWGYRVKKVEPNFAEIIVAENNFHGRTTTIVGFSTDPDSRDGFGPATPGFTIIPYNNPEALERSISKNTIAFLVEPIQGEAGIIIPDDDYLDKVGKISKKHNILLILDEIQTGFGRTGKDFAFQYSNIKPDILLVGKALGGGVYPISAALTRKEIMDVITPGSHGSTFGGNPLACAVGIASIELMKSEKYAERSAELGKYFLSKLRTIKSDRIKEIRGKGLFIGIEFKKEYGSIRPLVELLMNEGVLAKDTHENTLRMAPPFIIAKTEIDEIVNALERAIKKWIQN